MQPIKRNIKKTDNDNKFIGYIVSYKFYVILDSLCLTNNNEATL